MNEFVTPKNRTYFKCLYQKGYYYLVHSKDRIFLYAILRFIIMMNEWKKIGINTQLIGEDNFYRKNYWKGRHDVYEYIQVCTQTLCWCMMRFLMWLFLHIQFNFVSILLSKNTKKSSFKRTTFSGIFPGTMLEVGNK